MGQRFFPALWVAAFFFLVFTGTVVSPHAVALAALGIAGLLYCLAMERTAWSGMLRANAAIFAAALALALAIVWSESAAVLRGVPPSDPVPVQAALLLCLPVLALFLQDTRIFPPVVGLFCALCVWHVVMMPVEAVTGFKLTWNEVYRLEREFWPFRYQASGLAFQTFCFVGLLMPLFYLAWGPVQHGRALKQWQPPGRVMALLPLLWLVPVACVQSRSGLFGAGCAGLLAVAFAGKRPGRAGVLAMFGAAALALFLYIYLFSEGKSGPDLRFAYFKAYMLESLDPAWLGTGRGFSRIAPAPVAVPGLLPLAHSHNDLVQVFFSWGLPGLVAYAAFWISLLRLVWARFVGRGEYWPALALVAVIPNFVTDVGIHFFEKAAFLVILAAMCVACSAVNPWRSAGAGPSRRWPRTSESPASP